VNIPIGLFLLFLTGVAPLLAWRRTSVESIRRNFLWPSVGAAALVVILLALGVRHFYALVSFGLCLFVVWTILTEFYKGSRAIGARTGRNLLASMVELTHRNTRRYGGYIVHMGVVLMFIGFTGAAFNKDRTVDVGVGESFTLGRYELKVESLRDGDNENYSWNHAVIQVFNKGSRIGTLEPERRFYKSSRQGTSEVSIRRRLNEDLYLNFAGMTEDGSKATIQAYVFPLVTWIWVGFLVLVFGTLVCLVPNKVRDRAQPTEPVGVSEDYATVEG